MANSAGMLKESIWRDKDFRAISRTAQTTYAQLLSQKELDRAGMQPLQVAKWAKGCDSITSEDVWSDLKELEAARFVFVDEDTDEVFVRSYMRQSDITRYPNILKNALRCATMVASENLRHELAVELRRLRRAEATKVADEIDPVEPSENPSDNGSETLSQTVPEPSNPSRTVSKPPGVGEGEGEGESSLGGYVGGSRTHEADTNEPQQLSNDPPPPRCPKHIDDPTDAPCRACGVAREDREAWELARVRRDADARSKAAHAAAEARALAIANCDLCDEDGYRAGRSCKHDPDEDNRAARGMAMVRAALAKGDQS